MIQWVHSKQFRQFHEEEYKETLHSISKILKDLRFPSEQIYYLGNETFLIISYALDQETLTYKNAQTQASLKSFPHFKLYLSISGLAYILTARMSMTTWN